MPYIIIARNDIPDGLLQTLDLKPNTSQRRFPYRNPGQTGYRRNIPDSAAVVITAGVTDVEIKGLTAWFLGQVSSGAGTQATADITTVAVASLVDGDFFTVNDGQNTTIYEFAVTATYATTAGRVRVDVSGDTTADDVRDTLFALITADTSNDISAASGGAATVTMTNDNQNQLTASQNSANTENVADGGFAVANFAGATDSDALTVAEAAQNVTDVITEAQSGNALTLAAINTALTTGVITGGQVSEILDILAGRNFELPAASTLETAGEFIAAGAFDDTEAGFRAIYDGGFFRNSWTSGRLSLMRAASFEYGGVAGAAVNVYADDGSVYAP